MQDKAYYFYTAKTSNGQFCSGLVNAPKDRNDAPALALEIAKEDARDRVGEPFAISEFYRVE